MLKIYQLRLRQNSFDVTMKFRGVGVRVTFIDGNVYDGTPAKCYTNDPFKQRAIESSQMFKDGDIVLERQVEEESDRQAAAQKAATASSGNSAATMQPAPQFPAPPTEPVTEPAGDGAGDGGEKMEFANLAEAIMYIAQTWQIPVQTEKDARQVLKDHGITPVIKKGA